jgi:hypothetical protein
MSHPHNCASTDKPAPAGSLTGSARGKSNRAMGRLPLAGFALLAAAVSSQAAVRTVHVVERADVLDGRSFAKSGPYEKIIARAWFTLDPKLPANQLVRDLGLAVTNEKGLVEFSADVYVLKPRDPSKGNGTILLEVPNRGGKGMLNRFCFARTSHDPTKDEDFGDKWLLDEGYTLVWVGWQWDVPNRPGVLRLEPAPVRSDVPVPGLVRSEFIPDHPTKQMPLGDRGHTPIPLGKALRLLVRDSAEMAPVEIPRRQVEGLGELGRCRNAGWLPARPAVRVCL